MPKHACSNRSNTHRQCPAQGHCASCSLKRKGLCYGSALLLGLVPALRSHAVDFTLDDGEIKGKVTTRVVAGAGWRLNDRSRFMTGKGFRSDGKPKGGVGSDESDDGNLNFGKGDMYSNLYKATTNVDLKYRNFGVNVSARVWYDDVLKNHDVPQGNWPNNFRANSSLSDRGLDRDNKFSGFMWLNANAYGHFDLSPESAMDLRVGKQTIKWGEDLFASNLNQINPVDFTTLRRVGTDPQTEAQLPVEMVFGKFTFGKDWRVEAFWQWKWRPNEYDPCGTFFGGIDLGFDMGCGGATANLAYPFNAYTAANMPGSKLWLSDGFNTAVGAVVPRAQDHYGSNGGQYGVSLHYTAESIKTDFGAYYMSINSRSPFYAVTLHDMPGTVYPDIDNALLAAGLPKSLLPAVNTLRSYRMFWNYPDGIKITGLSASTKLGQWKVAGEVSYSRNQPVQYNIPDMLFAFLRHTGPLAAGWADTPGESFLGYKRFDKTQAQVNAMRMFKDVLGASTAMVAGEAVWEHVNLPPTSELRFGRSFHSGYAPFFPTDTCSPIGDPYGCRNDGFYTRNAWGYRLRGQLNYPVPGGWVISPSLTWSHDVGGYSVDNQINKGRKQYVFGLTGQYRKNYFVSLNYGNWIDGAHYNTLRDRDFINLAVGATF
ncbi:MAG: DUF1302 domain-containing protein [Fulvimonas sp.]|nr:DUF1302 domain-containing protein [Fulvimonas sp.]